MKLVGQLWSFFGHTVDKNGSTHALFSQKAAFNGQSTSIGDIRSPLESIEIQSQLSRREINYRPGRVRKTFGRAYG